MTPFDAVVVGAGPAGVTAALYLARSGCSVLLFEQLAPGGQILQTEALENYPGFPKGIKGFEFSDLLIEHLAGLNIIRPEGEVHAISGDAGNFLIKSGTGEEFIARTVLLCSGTRHRQLGLDKERQLIGRGVSYCALCDGNFFKKQIVGVVGGGNAALEESLYLARIADQVHLIHRRDSFRGNRVYQDKIASTANICLHLDTTIESLIGEESLTGVNIRNLRTGTVEMLPLAGLFIYVGLVPLTEYLPGDIIRDEQGFIITDTEMRTNIPGIYAAGDIRSKLCRQVITAAGDGATAAHAAFVFLEQLHA